jgi:hypothetical protein
MAAAITVIPASGSIIATQTVCTFAIAGTDANDPTLHFEDRYVLTFVVDREEVGRSQVFGTTPDGAFQFNGYIFPKAGTYTVQLYNVTDPTNPSAVSDAATIVVA